MKCKRQQLPWSRQIGRFVVKVPYVEFRNSCYGIHCQLRHVNNGTSRFGYSWWAPTGELFDNKKGKTHIRVSIYYDLGNSVWWVFVSFSTIDGDDEGRFELPNYDYDTAKLTVIKITRYLCGKGKRPKRLPSISDISSFVNLINHNYDIYGCY
jgi:hypothetical protein